MTKLQRKSFGGLVALGAVVCLVMLATTGPAAGARSASTAAACGGSPKQFAIDPHPAHGVNPLTGAQFFLDGPGTNKGFAATAIAQAIGRNPNSFGDISWARFARIVDGTHLSAGAAHRVHLLEKIGDQAEAKRFSVFTAGGGPGAIFAQTQKLLCREQQIDPGANALISTYFLKHTGNCRTNREVGSDAAAFRRHIDELRQAIGNFSTTILLETDAIGTAKCLSHAGLQDRENLLSYATAKLSKLPHTLVYLEGGTEDADSPQFAASVLKKSGVGRIRGFFVNDTHFNWTSNEINYSKTISRLVGGSHFIVSTQVNGRGPLLNRHPTSQGIENLCNPPGRGLGSPFNTNTGFFNQGVDAFMWTGVPGRSAGSCGHGYAGGGQFDTRLALSLSSNANLQLGPHDHSHPY